jgi:hypothetical protein
MPMLAWRIPRWVLPAALGGVLAMAGADAVLMRRHPVSARPRAVAQQIGLHADAEGEGLRVQWDRASRPIRNADRAVLFIEDGTVKSQLNLTGRQLDSSSVMYYPQSERGTFRLEVYRGGQSSSDSAVFGLPQDGKRHRQQGPARAIVQPVRPSPFEHLDPEIVVTQTLPVHAVAARAPVAEPEAASEPVALAEPTTESRLGRFLSRIPLLRHLRKHPPSDEGESR